MTRARSLSRTGLAVGLGLLASLALVGSAAAADDPMAPSDVDTSVDAPAGMGDDAEAERRCSARVTRCASSRTTTVRTSTSVRTRGSVTVTTRRGAPPPVRRAPPPARRAPPPVRRAAPPPRPRVVHARPAPPPRVVVSRPPPVRRVYSAPPRSTTVVVRHVRPWHGVFVYGPRPVYHDHYVTTSRQDVRRDHLPTRKVDRENSFALGLRSGSYISGYNGGGSYGDLGLGVVGRYRPEEALGLELLVQHHNETFDLTTTERAQTIGQGSVMLFANPWGRVQPYVLGGLSANARSLDDAVTRDLSVQTNDLLWGPHAGAGIEFAFGQRAALDLEARYVGWMNDREASVPGGLQTSANFLVHF